MIQIGEAKFLKQVRDDGESKKRLFDLLIKEDTLLIEAKARGNKKATLVDIKSILAPYTEPEEIEGLEETCTLIYNKI